MTRSAAGVQPHPSGRHHAGDHRDHRRCSAQRQRKLFDCLTASPPRGRRPDLKNKGNRMIQGTFPVAPVVDVQFTAGELPALQEALTVTAEGTERYHGGGAASWNERRCAASCFQQRWSGPGHDRHRHRPRPPRCRWAKPRWAVCSTCWAEPIDGKQPVDDASRAGPSTAAPQLCRAEARTEILETGIKVIDLLAPTQRAARSVCSAAPASARPS